MNSTTIGRPAADEHAEFYTKYVTRVPDGDLVGQLREQLIETATMLRGIPADRADFAYAPGKWSVKEVIGHMIDVERVMSYRAVRFARNDKTELPGFDENWWAANANFGARTIDDLVDELEVVRAATYHAAETLVKPKGRELDFGVVRPGALADLMIVDQNPLANLKVLYANGALKLNEQTGKPEWIGGVKYTIKDGIVYDAKKLMEDVARMVEDQRKKMPATNEDKSPPGDPQP